MSEGTYVRVALRVYETKIREQHQVTLHGHRLVHIRDPDRGLFQRHSRGRSHDVRHQCVPRGSSGWVTEDEQEGSGTYEGRSVRKNDNQGLVFGSKAVRVRDRWRRWGKEVKGRQKGCSEKHPDHRPL